MTMLEERSLRTADGVLLRYQVGGAADGHPVVFFPGFGVSPAASAPFLEELAGYRLVTWSYRHLFDRAARPGPGTLDGRWQAADLRAILDQEGISRATLVAWSLGPMIALPFHHLYPGRTDGIVVLCGTLGGPFSRRSDRLEARLGMFLASDWIPSPVGRLARLCVRRLAGTLRGYRVALAFRMIDPILPESAFRAMALDFSRCNHRVLWGMMHALHEERVVPESALAGVRVPMLFLAGDRDTYTPLSLQHRMAAAFPTASLRVVAGASHTGVLEKPGEFAALTRAFIDQVRCGTGASAVDAVA